jgi:phosphoribosylanthranilate isomerase
VKSSSELRVKICGITNTEDARACLDLGADYLGLIFADSPRQVTLAMASSIREAVPGARLVGVFADASIEVIGKAADVTGLDLIQLHGQETPAFCENLAARSGLPLVKAVRAAGVGSKPDTDFSGDGGISRFEKVAHFLFDLDKNLAQRQSEVALPALWKAAARYRRLGHSIFLAGALNPANVQEAVRATKPYGVDVCSGVEARPGRKDLKAVAHFIEEVKSASP